MTKVLVCGGRDYNDTEFLEGILDKLNEEHNFTTLISGCASGADSMAGIWAILNKIAVEEFPAEWKKDGRAAGPIRNQRMLVEGKPDLVVAFPGGRGTADMVRRARDAGVQVIEPVNKLKRS